MPHCLTLLTPHGARVQPLAGDGRLWLSGARAVAIGSGPRAHLQVEHEDVEPLHARLVCREQKWMLVDLRSALGTWLNDTRLSGPVALKGGERVRLGRAVAFSFDEVPYWPEGIPFVPDRLPQGPEEEERFAMLSDWLQERGHPLGEWMLACERGRSARGRSFDERAGWLGPLALEARRGQVSVRWRWGFFESAAVLGPSADGHDLLDQVAPLLQLPQGALLERLYIDRRHFRGPLQLREDDEALRAVLKATRHDRLEEVVVRVNRARWPLMLGAMRERFPRLKSVRFTADDERGAFAPAPR